MCNCFRDKINWFNIRNWNWKEKNFKRNENQWWKCYLKAIFNIKIMATIFWTTGHFSGTIIMEFASSGFHLSISIWMRKIAYELSNCKENIWRWKTNKEYLNIQEYTLSQPTLEQAFLELVRLHDKSVDVYT